MINKVIQGEKPVVVFVGPASCGKSMVMMSLIEYLRTSNPKMRFKPNQSYLSPVGVIDSIDKETLDNYKIACQKFNTALTKNAAASPMDDKRALDGSVDQILVDISIDGNLSIRMLEARGEDFFDRDEKDKPVEAGLGTIMSKNRISEPGIKPYPIYYVVLLDLHTDDNLMLRTATLRAAYENRIIDILDAGFNKKRGDRIIMVYNKWDLHEEDTVLDSILTTYYPRLKAFLTRKQLVFFTTPLYAGPIGYISGVNFHFVEEQYTDENGKAKNREVPYYKTNTVSVNCAAQLWKLLDPKKSLF